jgi:hypothetical protein
MSNSANPGDKPVSDQSAGAPQAPAEKTFVEENIAAVKMAAKDEVKRGSEWMVRRVIATISWEFTRLLQTSISKLFRR